MAVSTLWRFFARRKITLKSLDIQRSRTVPTSAASGRPGSRGQLELDRKRRFFPTLRGAAERRWFRQFSAGAVAYVVDDMVSSRSRV